MPTYDYVCDACEHAFEEFQSMSAKPLKKCPKCGKPKLRRLIGTGAGVIFKGSGFWQTDYRSESYKKGEKADAEAKKSATESKSDSGGKGDSSKKSDSGSKSEAKKPDSGSVSKSDKGSSKKD